MKYKIFSRFLWCPMQAGAALIISIPNSMLAEVVEEDAALSVQIVPTSSSEKGRKWIELWWPRNHFHVAVTHTTDKGIHVWKEWCSCLVRKDHQRRNNIHLRRFRRTLKTDSGKGVGVVLDRAHAPI